jgi:hypothetical protein
MDGLFFCRDQQSGVRANAGAFRGQKDTRSSCAPMGMEELAFSRLNRNFTKKGAGESRASFLVRSAGNTSLPNRLALLVAEHE